MSSSPTSSPPEPFPRWPTLLAGRESDPARLEQVAELYVEVVGMDAGHVSAALAGNDVAQ